MSESSKVMGKRCFLTSYVGGLSLAAGNLKDARRELSLKSKLRAQFGCIARRWSTAPGDFPVCKSDYRPSLRCRKSLPQVHLREWQTQAIWED